MMMFISFRNLFTIGLPGKETNHRMMRNYLMKFLFKKKEEIYSTKHPLMNNHGISSHCSNYYVLNLISLYATLAPKDIIQRHT